IKPLLQIVDYLPLFGQAPKPFPAKTSSSVRIGHHSTLILASNFSEKIECKQTFLQNNSFLAITVNRL
ncbi:hypothetical protein CE195_11440, partial [Sodalis-like symbiont of Philaenus spumarius]